MELKLWDILQFAGLAAWLGGALFFIKQLGVFSPRSLRGAPARESGLSLPVVGAVIVLYLLMQSACVLAAVGMGALPQSEILPARPAAASTSQPASGPATAPALTEADRVVVFNAISLACDVLTAIPVLLVLHRLFKDGFSGWGLHPRQLPKGFLKGIAGFFITYPVLIVFAVGLVSVYGLFRHEMSEHSTFEAMDQHISVGGQILLCITAIVGAPLSEELFFRGILQTTLVQYGWGFVVPQFMRSGSLPLGYRPPVWQRWAAILVTSALFAAAHQADQAPIILVLSLGLGYVYERTGILWAPIALHMIFNSTEIATYLSGR